MSPTGRSVNHLNGNVGEVRVRLPSQLRIHQRMGHMPKLFQQVLGAKVEQLGRRKPREMAAAELVPWLSNLIAESSLSRTAQTGSTVNVATNEAVGRYMPHLLKELIDNPEQRFASQVVYAQARLAASTRPAEADSFTL